MRGVVFLGDRQLEMQRFDDPTPGPAEVVLEMKASGMCGSDLKFYRMSSDGGGTAALGLGGDGEPVIAGHEPCGVVVAMGPETSGSGFKTGDRVMVHHYHGCGHCEHCDVGWSQLCQHGIKVYGVTGHGGHADYIKIPASTLVALPDALSFETGAAISCGTGTAYGALRRMNLSGRDTIAIFGQGPVGLSATQLAADAVVDPSADDPVTALKDLTHGKGVDLALDCSGVPGARLAAVQGTRVWGTVCFVGEGDKVTLDVSSDMLRKQLTIVASWTFSRSGQADCAEFIADRNIELDKLFTQRYQLDQAEEAYKLFDTQTTGKGVFLL